MPLAVAAIIEPVAVYVTAAGRCPGNKNSLAGLSATCYFKQAPSYGKVVRYYYYYYMRETLVCTEIQ